MIAFSLAGCATTRLIDSDVRSVSSFKSLPVSGYRFERTLLQQSPDQLNNQQALEAMAEAALAKVGLQRETTPSTHPSTSPSTSPVGYSVQVTARVRQDWQADPFARGMWPIHVGVGVGNTRRGGLNTSVGIGVGMGHLYRQAIYNREVSLLMRDLSTQQVVFESTAVNEGIWGDDNNILSILFEAAVSGFPTPPPGPRRVNIELPPPPSKK